MNLTASAPDEDRTLLEELLASQQQLSAVERFSKKHENGSLPSQARYYKALIPLDRPRAGEQYAFGVDLDACTGCKACVSACHSLNGLDEEEVWRNVGFIHGGSEEAPYQQTVTTACHHCADPACLKGCPVAAYEKDSVTGIVRHLDDQCIGCQYCVLKCPYDVPKYSKKRGIVRKCDMCQDRLGVGEAPACVQACPTEAISIRVINAAEQAASLCPGDTLLPGAFDSSYTRPTTRYTSRKAIPANARASDAFSLCLEHAHFPLVFMLVLTQMGAGLFLSLALVNALDPTAFDFLKASLALAAFGSLNAGLAVSVLHLGRPLGAWRAFLGLRTSWMSREIFAFGLFATVAAAFTLSCVWAPLAARIPALTLLERVLNPAALASPLAWLTVLAGALAIYCSAMIYIDTRRDFWSRPLTLPRFFGTTLLLGASGAATLSIWIGTLAGPAPALSGFTHAATLFASLLRLSLFGWETRHLTAAFSNEEDANHRSARILWNLQRPLVFSHAGCVLLGTLFSFHTLSHSGWPAAFTSALTLMLTLAGELLMRTVFFSAVVAPRMPGGIYAS